MSEQVVIWGSGGHALVTADVVRQAGRYKIAGFIDELNPQRSGEAFGGATILGGLEAVQTLLSGNIRLLLPGFGNVAGRFRLIDLAESRGFTLATAVHPFTSIAPDVTLGAGCVVVAGVVVNPAAKIGKAVILNTSCSVDHHCEIEDAAHIAPGARLAGGVRVGRGAWVGIGAIVREGITIGENAVVGAGAVVVRNVSPGATVVGNPAHIINVDSRAPHSA